MAARHLELTTKASYRSYLDKHFLPFFGEMPMRTILPSTVQAWVTMAAGSGLSPRSVVKYHVMLHSVFKRAVRDRVILTTLRERPSSRRSCRHRGGSSRRSSSRG